MNVKYHTLEQKLERLKEQVIELEKIKQEIESVKDLEEDYRKEALVERLFQIGLEAVLDIGRTIISMENLLRPLENKDIFKILARAGIFSEDFGKRAEGMGGFRNILVHGYMIIEEKRVFENLQKLNLFEEFIQFVLLYLQKKKVV